MMCSKRKEEKREMSATKEGEVKVTEAVAKKDQES